MSEQSPSLTTDTTRPRAGRAAWLAAAALAVVCVGLALERIERAGMTHVEMYVPGIEYPNEISVPPPRLDLHTTLRFHINAEPHPPGYFLMMLGWTKLAGTSLTAIRLPSVLFGGAALLLLFGFGTVAGRSTAAGLLAAAMFALNGHNLLWMTYARMYVPAMAFALASAWLWYDLVSGRGRLWKEAAYVAAIVLGLYFHTLMWPVLAAQVAFTLTRRPGLDGRPSRVYALQTLCVILGAPMLAHVVYIGQDVGSGGVPTLAFLQDYLNFGFLFTPDRDLDSVRDVPGWVELLLTAASLLCLAFFAVAARSWPDRAGDDEPPPRYVPWLLVALAIGMALTLIDLAQEAERRNVEVGLVAIVPVLAAGQLLVLERFPRIGRLLVMSRDRVFWNPLVAVGPGTFALMFAMAFLKPIAVSRGLLVCVPPLFVMLAVGLAELARRWRLAAGVVGMFIFAMHAWSAAYYRDFYRLDYRGAAEQLEREIEPGDLIFVQNRDWVTTPVFYHIRPEWPRLIASDYVEASADPAVRRIWVFEYNVFRLPPEMAEALAGFTQVRPRTFRRGFALYERTP